MSSREAASSKDKDWTRSRRPVHERARFSLFIFQVRPRGAGGAGGADSRGKRNCGSIYTVRGRVLKTLNARLYVLYGCRARERKTKSRKRYETARARSPHRAAPCSITCDGVEHAQSSLSALSLSLSHTPMSVHGVGCNFRPAEWRSHPIMDHIRLKAHATTCPSPMPRRNSLAASRSWRSADVTSGRTASRTPCFSSASIDVTLRTAARALEA